MPIITSSSSSSSSRASLTVATVLASTERDVQKMLFANSNSAQLVDYVDRIHLELCRKRDWDFLISAPKRFTTIREQTDYWIGATGSEPDGVVDTALNLTDVRFIEPLSVKNRTSHIDMDYEGDLPITIGHAYADARSTAGVPVEWKTRDDNPLVLSIFPAPDKGSDYEPVPSAPDATYASGGALSARTYYVRVAWFDAAGNSSAASEISRHYIPASNLITVKAPQPPTTGSSSGINYTHYKVYASTTEGSETLQSSLTAITADWTEDATGLVAGAAYPTSSDVEPLRGYVIEFRYHKKISRLTASTDSLQLPDDYRDVIIAGVNWLAFTYIDDIVSDRKAAYWKAIYEDLKRDFIRNEMRRIPNINRVGPDPGWSN